MMGQPLHSHHGGHLSQPHSPRDGSDIHTASPTSIISAVLEGISPGFHAVSNALTSGCGSSSAQSPSPSAHFKGDKHVYHGSSQDQAGFSLKAAPPNAERSPPGCWKHQGRATPLSGQPGLSIPLAAAGSSHPRLQAESSILIITGTRCSSHPSSAPKTDWLQRAEPRLWCPRGWDNFHGVFSTPAAQPHPEQGVLTEA